MAPSANFVNSSDTFGGSGNDHWLDPGTQWSYCKPDLDQDFVYCLGFISPTLTGNTRMKYPVSKCQCRYCVQPSLGCVASFASVQLSEQNGHRSLWEGQRRRDYFCFNSVAGPFSWDLATCSVSGLQPSNLIRSGPGQGIMTVFWNNPPSVSLLLILDFFHWYRLKQYSGQPLIYFAPKNTML